MARDEVTPRREKKSEFAKPASREVSDEQLQALAVAKFAKSTVVYDSLDEAFPVADPGLKPFGADVLVQLKSPKNRTKEGLWIPEESRETDMWNMQVAKVIAFGPVAFMNRETMKPWPECRVSIWVKLWYWVRGKKAPTIKPWAGAGEYIRVPKMGGDRWWVDVPGSRDGRALFVLMDDLVLKGLIPPEKVLDMVAYL